MYNEWFSHMNNFLQNDISYFLKVKMVLVKMNLSLSLPAQPHFYIKWKKINT